jgi:hypothetical protein
VKCSASRLEASERSDRFRPLYGHRPGAVKDEIHELLPQGSVRWSANPGVYYSMRCWALRTGCLAVRPATTEVWRNGGLFVEPRPRCWWVNGGADGQSSVGETRQVRGG